MNKVDNVVKVDGFERVIRRNTICSDNGQLGTREKRAWRGRKRVIHSSGYG